MEENLTSPLDIRLTVSRANPLILRGLRISRDRSLADLAVLSCVALGLAPEEIGSRFLLGELPLEDTKLLGDVAQPGDTLRLALFDPKARNRDPQELLLFLDVLEGPPPGDGQAAAEEGQPPIEGLPSVTMAVGRNLPPGIYDIRTVDRIQTILKDGGICRLESGAAIDEQTLAFVPRKTDNALRRRFAPETAVPELNARLGMSMRLLLDKIKLPDLKGIAEAQDMYIDSTTRKPILIDRLCSRYDGAFLVRFFQNLSLREFLALRRFLQMEDPDAEGEDWEDRLDSLYQAGLYTDVPKLGSRVASELLNYYDTWYATETEEQFLREKYLEAAARASMHLYGVFSREQFDAVLAKLDPPAFLTAEAATQWLSVHADEHNRIALLAQSDGVFYHKDYLSAAEARKLWGKLQHERFGMPRNRDAALAMAEQDIGPSPEGDQALRSIIRRHSYFSYYSSSIERSYRRMVFAWRCGEKVKDAAKEIIGQMGSLRWNQTAEASAIDEIAAILSREDQVPMICYNGFPVRDCPREIRAHWEAGLQQEEEQKRAVAEKKTVAKRTAAKRRR